MQFILNWYFKYTFRIAKKVTYRQGWAVSKVQWYLVFCIVIHHYVVSCTFYTSNMYLFLPKDTRHYYYKHLYWIIVPRKLILICRALKTQINVTIVVIFFVNNFVVDCTFTKNCSGAIELKWTIVNNEDIYHTMLQLVR